MSNQTTRPSIPYTTRFELWGRAAGRCEFRGCNRLIFKDEVTQKRSNLSNISHIVAFSSEGPRGDPVRSKLLEIDINNLMLTCQDHGKLIDDKAREAEYPEDLLLEYKREHEQRIRILTDIREDAKTHVLLLQVPIGSHDFSINTAEVYRAILPKYPSEELPFIINLQGMAVSTSTQGFFDIAASRIENEVRFLLNRNSSSHQINTLSVFALAPVPLLIFLGTLLGDIEQIDLYQRHRDHQNWLWKEEQEEFSEFYDLILPEKEIKENQKIAVILSVSNSVKRDEIQSTLGDEPYIYEIRAKNPSFDFLKSRKRLEVFGFEVRKLFEELRIKHAHNCNIHLFAAVPSPIAIEFGRNLKRDHQSFQLYEYHREARSHLPVLKLNQEMS